MTNIFITATDTDAGKTLIACALVKKLTQRHKVAAFKPISAGCERIEDVLVNEDAKLLHDLANCQQSLTSVNPIAFEPPIAPHIAAQQLGRQLDVAEVLAHFHTINQYQPEIIITEGAGGWRLPLGNGRFLSEFAIESQQGVVLVVNMKLGCLNHAVLTYQAIIQDGLTCLGWVANCVDDMPYLNENITELKSLIDTPLIGIVPKVSSIEEAAEYLTLDFLNR